MADQHYEGKLSAFPVESIKPQEQNRPGLDAKMDPMAEFTRLETYDLETNEPKLAEYIGCNKLKGRACLLTGADSGIARSAALLMAREGANISIVYLPAEQKDADDVKKQIEEKEGTKCLLLPYDLTKRDNCKIVVDKHIETYGRLDVLVNNSARQKQSDNFAEIDLDDVELTYRTNIWTMFAVTKYAMPHLKRGASIINTGSVAAAMGNPSLVDYSSTKAAIATFTKSLALQLAPKGIRVNCIAPGIIFTPFQPTSNDADTMKQIGKGEPPLGRPGQPSELGPAYVWLASAESSYITGTVIHINGGIDVSA
ncbi:uncharacterized protein L969DRAFT_90428 [Mixia osmundae IAM 14324]|uniref:Uncharacterized protein n=1 Tax=Mixia osmundae (strain CBS 9802 / IAM 14324 / JCM 22182 / KY 12970) TaxID=764103 RepID=G7E2F5_MIXOS|nr:uncharacterized protein L969DRAFT_90428 [Mixia osmundae IAM 14324]KEI36884.1 hypothetical protein L969DRAFT_90428 [Mixia osmundae IAM 14324]GAA97015.1 hypothetical protein E5Q_03689 [Mixia osmundae IAM 14324]